MTLAPPPSPLLTQPKQEVVITEATTETIDPANGPKPTDKIPLSNNNDTLGSPSKGHLDTNGTQEREQQTDAEIHEEINRRKANLQFLWFILPGIVVLLGCLGVGLCRRKKKLTKEKLTITKSVSVETGQTMCKDVSIVFLLTNGR